jgi:hypothetical protein
MGKIKGECTTNLKRVSQVLAAQKSVSTLLSNLRKKKETSTMNSMSP